MATVQFALLVELYFKLRKLHFTSDNSNIERIRLYLYFMIFLVTVTCLSISFVSLAKLRELTFSLNYTDFVGNEDYFDEQIY